MDRDSGAGAYSNLGMSVQGGIRQGSLCPAASLQQRF
jgi:hypothetical protein